jgi:hypothetical protein
VVIYYYGADFKVSFLNSKVQFESPTMVKVKISTGAGDLSTV